MNRPRHEPTSVQIKKDRIVVTWDKDGWTRLVATIYWNWGTPTIRLTNPCSTQTLLYLIDLSKKLKLR
jgi:hypothetical protein